MHKTLIYNIGNLYTPIGEYKRGKDMSNILNIGNAYILIEDDKIKEIGTDYSHITDAELFDARGMVALPGFVDSHTHLVYGGSREHEFSKKIAGVPYLDILKSGGGILSSVEMTRNTPIEELTRRATGSLYELASYGVTTVEAKSGYGLNRETEFKQLDVLKTLKEKTPFTIVSTYLGAHAVPKGVSKEEYITSLLEDIEEVAKQNKAEFVDVFCEDSVFNVEDSKRILEHGKKHGLKIKIHADEIVSLGGAGLAVELKAASADHLMAISKEDIKKIANSNTVANLLPSTSFYLNKDYAPARELIDQGAIVSLSSDLNPGSSPSENFQFMAQLGCIKLKMIPEEVLSATTINGAYNLGLSKEIGSLEVGKQADIVIMDALNLEYIYYHYGINHTKHVFKNGRLIMKNRRFI